MANTRILNAAVVAALFAACTDVPCETKGAVRDHRDVCGCPDGTREVERVVNDDSKSECVSGDAGGVTIDNASETDASRARPAAADGGREMDASLFVDAANAKEAGEETEAAVLTADDAGDALTLADADSAETPLVPQAPACVPTAEMCDGHDNDCDGVIDQGVKTRCWADADGDGYAAAGAALVESCDACGAKQTAQEPVAGKADCDDADTKKSPGATDICGDKVDNDCDGKPDDDDNNACGGACSVQLPGKPGDACNNGQQGACARAGTYECRPDHSMVCNAPMVRAAAAEVCGNGKDDDCKGGVDDGCVKNLCGGWSSLANAVGAPCTVAVRACSYPGTYQCAPSATDMTACTGQAPAESCGDRKDNDCDGMVDEGCCVPTTEVCDRKDNDCDGMVDEGFVTGGACTAGKGECLATGTLECDQRGAVACNAVAKAPTAEICGDGKDNNCNDIVDDGVKNACGACGAVPAEVCDGMDNDCDGMVNEGLTNECGGPCTASLANKPGAACTNGQFASCQRSGKFVCQGTSATVCDAPKVTLSAEESIEYCDGLDNDCDGTADEPGESPESRWYHDCDGDGYAPCGELRRLPVLSCTTPPVADGCGWTKLSPGFTGGDADDASSSIGPSVACSI